MREQRKKEQEEFKNKCLGPTFINTKQRIVNDQIDKNKVQQ